MLKRLTLLLVRVINGSFSCFYLKTHGQQRPIGHCRILQVMYIVLCSSKERKARHP